ncbi:hypothetical protein HED51_14790 [Ochrobactrum grignonense]|nr:hypothetical protein [Brucella grignonensis]
MMTIDTIPGHIDPMNDESYWSRMQLQFDSLSSLFDMRFETMEEAVGHEEEHIDRKRLWVSDAPAGTVGVLGCCCRISTR